MPLPWLVGVKKRKSTDVPIFLDARLWEDLESIINVEGWPYKTNIALFRLRDRALICLLILTGLRISEALLLKRLQFRIYKRKILLANAETVKHGLLRTKIILPKQGKLSTFTFVFEEWLNTIPKLFTEG